MTVRQKVGGRLKFFLILTGASAAGFVASVLLHNFIYGLFIVLFGQVHQTLKSPVGSGEGSRPGGRLAIAMGFNADDGQDHTKYARTFHMKLYSENQMRSLLEQSGFSSISFTFAKGLALPRIMIAGASRPL